MRKKVFGRQFKRDTNERKALFKGLMTSLILHEQIETTEEKAKAIKGSVEKLVTKAKRRGQEAIKFLVPYLAEKEAVTKVIDDLAIRFAKRNGGYTRIIKLHRRISDNAPMVRIEWVEKSTKLQVQPVAVKIDKKKETQKSSEIQEAEIVTKKEEKDSEDSKQPKKREKKVSTKKLAKGVTKKK